MWEKGNGIVITGAPASAKTEFIEKLKSEPGFSRFLFFDELARILLNTRPELRNDWPRLHREIFTQQSKREADSKGQYFISDRGTVDTFAFHPQTIQDMGTTLKNEYARYSAVILLESSARLGETYYIKDEIRNESLDEALIIEDKLKKVWQDHPGYHLIKARDDINEKYTDFKLLLFKCLEILKGINNSDHKTL